jgi:antitoxin MazE
MQHTVRAKVVRVGNSRGFRIPRPLLEMVGLYGDAEVDVEVQHDQIVIRPAGKARRGWDEQFRTMAERDDDRRLEPEMARQTSWDDAEWEW